jgi:hypothetical protein
MQQMLSFWVYKMRVWVAETLRVWFALTVWIASVLLLWLGGGLGVRPSAVLSLIVAFFFDRLVLVDRALFKPKGGVLHLRVAADLGGMLLDLGIIDHSTNRDEIVALQEVPVAVFPVFVADSYWIPEANLIVWPSIQEYRSKFELNVTIRLPKGCPFAESLHRESSRHSEGVRPLAEFLEDDDRKVKFFVEDGYPEHKFGLWVPKAFAEERIKAGGFGSACIEYKERFGQFQLVVGRFPFNLFCQHFPEREPGRNYERYLDAQRAFYERLKVHCEQLGWESEGTGFFTTAKHKYMTTVLLNREQ